MRLVSIFMITLAIFLSGCGKSSKQQVYTGVIEGRVVEVPGLTGGKILTLFVEEGDSVTAGDTLAVLDTLEISLNLKNLRGAWSEIQIQRKIAEQKVEMADTDYQYLKTRLERTRQLFKENSVPRQTFDDMKNRFEKARIALTSARKNLQIIESKEMQLSARIQILKKRRQDAIVRAPISGVVSEKYHEAGEAIPPGGSLVELINLNEVWVKIYISEKMLPRIRYLQPVTVKTDGLEKEFAGRITWISPKAEFTPKTILTPETRTSLVYAVKVTIANPEHELKQGMPVEVRF